MWFNFSSLSWSLIWHGRQHDVFCVVDNNFFFDRSFRVKYCFSSHEYCMPENQEWLKTITGVKGYQESNATISTLQAEMLLDSTWQSKCMVGQLCKRHCCHWRLERKFWSNMWKLSKLLQPHIEGKTTRMRCPVDITKKVACTLYYLSNRGCLRKTANAFGLSHQVVSKIIREVCRAMAVHLGSEYTKRPSTVVEMEDLVKVSIIIMGFLNVLGQ